MNSNITEQVKSYEIDFKIINPAKDFPVRNVKVRSTKEDIEQLIEKGYLLIDNLFSDKIINDFSTVIDKIGQLERDYIDPNKPDKGLSSQYLRWLLDKDPVFVQLFECKETLSIARAVLGPQIKFSNVDARIVHPERDVQVIPWHIHLRVVPNPLPPFFCYPHAIHCLLYLDDVTQNEGGICVLPGSHANYEIQFAKDDISDKEGQEVIYPKRGTCLVIHGNLWHRTLTVAPNAKGRRLVIFGYSPSWLREEQGGGVRPEKDFFAAKLQTESDPIQRELLGEFAWC